MCLFDVFIDTHKNELTHRGRAKQMNRLLWFDFVCCTGQSMTEVPLLLIVEL